MRPRCGASGHLQVYERVRRRQVVPCQEFLEHRRQVGGGHSPDLHRRETAGQAVHVPLDLEQAAAVGAQHLVHPVGEQETPVIGRHSHVLPWEELAVEVCCLHGT